MHQVNQMARVAGAERGFPHSQLRTDIPGTPRSAAAGFLPTTAASWCSMARASPGVGRRACTRRRQSACRRGSRGSRTVHHRLAYPPMERDKGQSRLSFSVHWHRGFWHDTLGNGWLVALLVADIRRLRGHGRARAPLGAGGARGRDLGTRGVVWLWGRNEVKRVKSGFLGGFG